MCRFHARAIVQTLILLLLLGLDLGIDAGYASAVSRIAWQVEVH